MAKGERVKLNTRTKLEFKAVADGAEAVETFMVQVPPGAYQFHTNLIYRVKQMWKKYPAAERVLIRNPSAPSEWVDFGARFGEFGKAKSLYRILITEPRPKCPHCGKYIDANAR